MVGVELFDLALGQHLRQDRAALVGHHRDHLKAHELAVLGLLPFHTEHQVFDADAVLPGEVQARLVRGQHALLEGSAAVLIAQAQALRPFVHIQQIANAVAGAVVVIQSQLPQRHTRQHVEVDAGAALLEAGGRHVQMPAQDGGIVPLLLLGQFADGHGSGDIGAALEVVSAGVDQEEAVVSNGDIGFFRRLIVDDRAVFSGGDDGGKALVDEIRAFTAEAQQLRADVQLGDLTARDGAALLLPAQPADHPRHGHAVLNMRLAFVFHLDGGLFGLGQRAGIRAVDELHALGYRGDQSHVGARAAEQQALPGGQRFQVFIDLQIGPQGHAVGLESGQQLRGYRFGRRIKDRVIRAQQRVGIEHRAVRDVSPAQIEEPGDVIQRGEQVPVGAEAGHLLAQEAELVGAALPGIALLQLPDRVGREGRAIRPELSDEVERLGIADLLTAEGGFQRAGVGVGDSTAVIAEALAVPQRLFEIFGDGRHAGLAHFAQLDAGAAQLLGRSEEITPVGPEAGLVRRHDQRAGAAAKAGEPLAALEIAVHIFGGVEIVRQHHIGVDAVFPHLLPQRSDARADRRIFDNAHEKKSPFLLSG